MFEFLKKKITGFIDKVTGKKEGPATEKETLKPSEKLLQQEPVKEVEIVKQPEQLLQQEIVKTTKTERKKELEQVKEETKKLVGPPKKDFGKDLKTTEKKEIKEEHKKEVKKERTTIDAQQKKEHTEEIKLEPKIQEIKIETKYEPTAQKINTETEYEPKKDHAPKIGIFTQIKSVISGEIQLNKNEVDDLLNNLELELIEGDVALEVAESIKKELEDKLVDVKVKKNDVNNFIKNAIKETLFDIINNKRVFDVVQIISNYDKPVKIMFLGVNGSGKTTSIAKVAKMLIDGNYKVVFAAADTFRAAAIEQLGIHGDRLNIKTIKREYGSDPTAVAYDAVNYAKTHAVDVVLIDTAGRQETNFNLINEMKKMQRVIQPNLKIYIGESIAGNAIIQQVSEFNKEIGIDAVILTKLDCDAKGGTVLSISKATGIPIIYLGTGQNYDDIEKFDAVKIINRILS